MEHTSSRSEAVVQNTLATLPVEVLVYIFSFLSTRDKVRIRCISKTLRSVSEVPSLWEDFMWSRYAPRDEKLLKHVLKMFGQYVKRIHFADHIAPSKLEVMLKFCKNAIHLSVPSFYYGYLKKLEKIVHKMENVQILDILVSSVFATDDVFIQQCFILCNNLKEVTLHYRHLTSELIRQCLEEWANSNYVPRKLNFFTRKCMEYTVTSSLQSCVPVLRNKALLQTSDSGDIAQVNIYFKTLANSSTTIPFIQLRITDSSVTLSVVKASKFGILGLPFDTLHLTEGSYRGKKVHKALLTLTDYHYIDTSVTSLSSVTYFDASCCRFLHPGHLEQLSIVCPNLQRLDLTRNHNCLNSLQGLHSLANNCRSLQGLSLLEIHVHDCEYSCIQLWEILCTMRLTQLAIETCMINICDHIGKAKSVASAAKVSSAQVKRQKLNEMFQRYSSLRILEVGIQHLRTYQTCYNPSDSNLLLVTNFPSITYYRLCSLPSNNCHHTLKRIFCQKYLRCLFLSKTLSGILSLSLEGHCSSLQQVYIHSRDTAPTDAFIDALCGHGGLEHVILCVKSLTAKSIETLIEHSSNLVTFRVYLYSRAFLKFQLKELIATIKRKFSKRKLFNGGNFDIQVSYRTATVEVNEDTDLSTVWDFDPLLL